jgi:hypothetical protein
MCSTLAPKVLSCWGPGRENICCAWLDEATPPGLGQGARNTRAEGRSVQRDQRPEKCCYSPLQRCGPFDICQQRGTACGRHAKVRTLRLEKSMLREGGARAQTSSFDGKTPRQWQVPKHYPDGDAPWSRLFWHGSIRGHGKHHGGEVSAQPFLKPRCCGSPSLPGIVSLMEFLTMPSFSQRWDGPSRKHGARHHHGGGWRHVP